MSHCATTVVAAAAEGNARVNARAPSAAVILRRCVIEGCPLGRGTLPPVARLIIPNFNTLLMQFRLRNGASFERRSPQGMRPMVAFQREQAFGPALHLFRRSPT